jgi:hypothetical protein
MPAKLLLSAIAAPESPAIKAWLSLVGIPSTEAAVAHTTMATIAAQRPTMLLCASPPKSTMLKIVCATVALSIVMRKTPRKFITAAIAMAARIDIARVDTAVAIALGASVHPLTRITPIVRITVTASIGFDVTSRRKDMKSIVMSFSCCYSSLKIQH